MKQRGEVVLLALLLVVVSGYNTTDTPAGKHNVKKRQIQCTEEEYPTENHCCKLCNVGTYAKSDCTVDHGNPECMSCSEGVDYMDEKNGYHKCHQCSKCDTRIGLQELEACTVSNNTICHCKENSFCAQTSTLGSCSKCEECTICSKGIIEKCTANKDSVCTPMIPRHHKTLYIVIPLAVLSLCTIVYLIWKGKPTHTLRVVTRPSPTEPPAFPEELKDMDIQGLLHSFSKEMPYQTVLNVVRNMGLSETRIDEITNDNKDNTEEKKYQLLVKWYNSKGRHGAFQLLIHSLQQEQEPRIVENLIEIARSKVAQAQG